MCGAGALAREHPAPCLQKSGDTRTGTLGIVTFATGASLLADLPRISSARGNLFRATALGLHVENVLCSLQGVRLFRQLVGTEADDSGEA